MFFSKLRTGVYSDCFRLFLRFDRRYTFDRRIPSLYLQGRAASLRSHPEVLVEKNPGYDARLEAHFMRRKERGPPGCTTDHAHFFFFFNSLTPTKCVLDAQSTMHTFFFVNILTPTKCGAFCALLLGRDLVTRWRQAPSSIESTAIRHAKNAVKPLFNRINSIETAPSLSSDRAYPPTYACAAICFAESSGRKLQHERCHPMDVQHELRVVCFVFVPLFLETWCGRAQPKRTEIAPSMMRCATEVVAQ